MASVSDLPWVYDYQEEARGGGAEFLDKPLLRPVVSVTLANAGTITWWWIGVADTMATKKELDTQLALGLERSASAERLEELRYLVSELREKGVTRPTYDLESPYSHRSDDCSADYRFD